MVKLFFEKELISPFSARYTPTTPPAKTERVITNMEKSLIENLSQVEKITA